MNNFNIIWKFAVISFFICIIIQINQLERAIKECLLIPEPALPEYIIIE